MWEETLIESKGRRAGKHRWGMVALSVSFHVTLVGLMIAGSFWYLEAVEPQTPRMVLYQAFAPPQDSIPVALRHGTPEGNDRPVKPEQRPLVTQQPEVTQDRIDPNTNSEMSDAPPSTRFDLADIGPIGTGPLGDPQGTSIDGPVTGPHGDGINTPMILESGMEQPVLVHRVQPLYPEIVRLAHIEGFVVLKAIILRTGDVEVREVVQSVNPILAREAIRAVSQWKYRPARLADHPVSVWFNVTVSFKLR